MVLCFSLILFFFFKQKTAYEMLRSLVGSEMCIRDRHRGEADGRVGGAEQAEILQDLGHMTVHPAHPVGCLLYTSDAADDLLCVDFGGRRIIKKKKKHNIARDINAQTPTDTHK